MLLLLSLLPFESEGGLLPIYLSSNYFEVFLYFKSYILFESMNWLFVDSFRVLSVLLMLLKTVSFSALFQDWLFCSLLINYIFSMLFIIFVPILEVSNLLLILLPILVSASVIVLSFFFLKFLIFYFFSPEITSATRLVKDSV